MECHHIDYSEMQIHVDVRKGREKAIFTCILCDSVFDEKQYKEVLKEIKKHMDDHTISFYKTPNGKTHTEEDCADKRRCPIHEVD